MAVVDVIGGKMYTGEHVVGAFNQLMSQFGNSQSGDDDDNSGDDDDKKKKRTSIGISKQGNQNQQLANSRGEGQTASGLAIGWGIALGEPTPAGEIILGLATTGAVLYYGLGIVDKMSAEIDRILKRSPGPQGFAYELRVNKSGAYRNVRGGNS